MPRRSILIGSHLGSALAAELDSHIDLYVKRQVFRNARDYSAATLGAQWNPDYSADFYASLQSANGSNKSDNRARRTG